MPLNRARHKPVALDLFSEAGGLSLGLRLAGFKVVGAIEAEPLAASTYRRNFPNVRLWDSDIRRVPAAEVARKLGIQKGRLDLLAGCPPCQGFSAVRRLNGARRI